MGSCYTGSKRSPEHALQSTVEKNTSDLKEIKDLLKNGRGRGGGNSTGGRGRGGGGRGAGGRGGRGGGHEAKSSDPSVLNEKLSRTCIPWNSGESRIEPLSA